MKYNFDWLKSFVATHYGNNPGKVLVHTGVVGWVLSSLAQVGAIIINDKIPKKQKLYMIPQEFADAAVNIVSFFAVTQLFNSTSLKLVNTGKLLPKSVRTALTNANIKDVGKKSFDVLTHGNLSEALKDNFIDFRNGVDVVGTTLGSILSCNIITPIVRNEIASNRQKKLITKFDTGNTKGEIPFQSSPVKRPTMNDFRNMSGAPYSGSLKI